MYQFSLKPSQGGVLQGFPPNPKIQGPTPGPLGGWPIVPLWALGALVGPVCVSLDRWALVAVEPGDQPTGGRHGALGK